MKASDIEAACEEHRTERGWLREIALQLARAVDLLESQKPPIVESVMPKVPGKKK